MRAVAEGPFAIGARGKDHAQLGEGRLVAGVLFGQMDDDQFTDGVALVEQSVEGEGDDLRLTAQGRHQHNGRRRHR